MIGVMIKLKRSRVGKQYTPAKDSQLVTAAAYKGGTLRLVLKDAVGMPAGIYEYYEVPSIRYAGFFLAKSPGHYFNAFIKGKYQYKKVS
jgi:hypothetical protein